MKVIDIIGVLAMLLALAGSTASADTGELVAMCADCHGADGVSAHEDVPTIAGQSKSYLAKTLRTYQIWGRPCIKSSYRSGDTSRPPVDMCKITEGLTGEDIAALSEHYSQLPFRPAKQAFEPDLVPVGAELHDKHCEKCHEQGGRHADNTPILAGQWTSYLRTSLKYVPTGEHLVPPLMEKTVADMGKDEIDALMSFYASRQE
jgi:sulfide dehydrogenase cytochrome subunit